MNKKEAKLKYKPKSFEIIEKGDFVVCAFSKKNILLENLSYWNVDFQEAYYSAEEANLRYLEIIQKK